MSLANGLSYTATILFGESSMKSHNATAQFFAGILIIAYVTVAASYWILSLSDPILLTQLGREDNWIESTGAAFFLIASIVMLGVYIKSVGQTNTFFGYIFRRNVYFILLSFLFFICFGEEISWGQRIFGWETPQALREINAQNETNLHNLWLFQSTNPDGSAKTFLELFLNTNRLLSIFWLSYCVLVPIVNAHSEHLRRFFAFTGAPIPSLLVGGLFLVNYITFRSALVLVDLNSGGLHALDELKETNYGVAFTVMALFFLAKQQLVQSTPQN